MIACTCLFSWAQGTAHASPACVFNLTHNPWMTHPSYGSNGRTAPSALHTRRECLKPTNLHKQSNNLAVLTILRTCASTQSYACTVRQVHHQSAHMQRLMRVQKQTFVYHPATPATQVTCSTQFNFLSSANPCKHMFRQIPNTNLTRHFPAVPRHHFAAGGTPCLAAAASRADISNVMTGLTDAASRTASRIISRATSCEANGLNRYRNPCRYRCRTDPGQGNSAGRHVRMRARSMRPVRPRLRVFANSDKLDLHVSTRSRHVAGTH